MVKEKRTDVNGRKLEQVESSKKKKTWSAMFVDPLVSVLFDPCWSTRGLFEEREKKGMTGGETLRENPQLQSQIF